MKKFVFLALAFIAGSMQVHAYDDWCASDCTTNCFGIESTLNVAVGGGYRHDTLKWKTFAPGVEIKEKWKDLNMGIVEANAQLLVCEHYLVAVDFDYGWFDRGGRHRIRQFDLITGSSDEFRSRVKGEAYDVSGAIGYQFNWDCYRYSLAPIVGYSYNYQRFKNQREHRRSNDSSSFASFGRRNNYRFEWNGPFLGFVSAFQPTCDWQVYFSYAYHWAWFQGRIHERSLLAGRGRQHSNNVSGNEFCVGSTYEFCDNWFLGLNFDYKCFFANKGRFKRRLAPSVEERFPLRKLDWQSFYVTVDVGYVF